MRTRAFLGLPLLLAGTSCTSSLRFGPEIRSQTPEPVLGGQGTLAVGLGDVGPGGTQLTTPVSFSAERGLHSGAGEGSFETGLELTETRDLFGYRIGPRLGVELGRTNGSYLGLRGGPLLMFSPPEEDKTVFGLTLEGLIGAGLGGDVNGHGIFGLCLSLSADTYPPPLRLPSGRPLRDRDGTIWRGEAGLGRGTGVRLGRQLSRDQRELEGTRFVADGLQELASIATFERLAAELALAGAPRALVRDAHGAARDEADHARRCFALASAYLGREVRPPRPPEAAPRRGRSRQQLALESWFDGCLGEGAAARDLLERARRSDEPEVRRSLAEIAREESRHAALAWNVVRWGCQRG